MSDHTAENALPRDQHMIPTDDALAADGCNWPRCRSPQTGKCFAWCKCRCHAERSAKHAARERDYELAENNARRDVVRWVTRLIDYGKSGSDPELDDLSLGQVADRIIGCVIPPGEGQP